MTNWDWKDRDAFTGADFAEVRARVMSEVGRRRRHVWMAYAAAAAAMVVIVGAVWIWRLSRVVEKPPVARTAPHWAPPPPIVVPRMQAVIHAARPKRRPVQPARPVAPSEPLMVKLETSDPDVVIYWIVESKGDSE